MSDHLWGPLDAGRNHRYATSQSFQNDHRHPFSKQAGQYHRVESSHDRRHVFGKATQVDNPTKVQSMDESTNARFILRSFETTDHFECDSIPCLLQLCNRLEQDLDPFSWTNKGNHSKFPVLLFESRHRFDGRLLSNSIGYRRYLAA